MAMTKETRESLIRRYAEGPGKLRTAWERVPADARKWRPGPARWSAHEVVCHCADSETNAAMRIRYLLAEENPLIAGYGQTEWARQFDYHELPAGTALSTVEAVRAGTVPLLRRLSETDWAKTGRHSEMEGPFGVEQWLEVYSEHLEKHSGQILRNLQAWAGAK
jgi:DinB superfamily